MFVKLISPRMSLRPMDSGLKSRMAPPLSLLVLGALTPSDIQVVMADENVDRVRFDDRPHLVAITVKVDTALRSWEIADAYRKRGVKVVLGGIHPTMQPEENLAHADSIVIGEAETQWADLLNDFRLGRLKRVYRCSHPPNMELTPIPRWELAKGKDYLYTNTICATRGCPWQCNFCYRSSRNFWKGYRTKPIANILAEIELLKTNHVMFIDDNLIGNPGFTRELLDAISSLGLIWHAAVSADIGRHDDLLDRMARSGCKSLFIGFESISTANIERCRKCQNAVSEYDSTIQRIHELGIMVNASLVFGFDSDGPEVFPQTLKWLVRNKVETMTAHILTPYPGTEFYTNLLAEGRIIDFDLRHYNTAHVVFRPAQMPPEELQYGYEEMYRKFYSFKSIWQRMPEDSARKAAYLLFNLGYRKFGSLTAVSGRLGLMQGLGRLAKRLSYPQRKIQGSLVRKQAVDDCVPST